MVNFAFLPGFALKSGMYSRLDAFNPDLGIDIDVKTNWVDTVESIADNIRLDSIIIGYSQGARLALNVALDYPSSIKGLILISGNCGLTTDQERNERRKSDSKLCEIAKENSKDFWDTFDSNVVFQKPNPIDVEFIEEHRKTDEHEIAYELSILGLGQMPNLQDRLIELRLPVLYLSGSLDKKYCELNAKYKKMTPFSHHRVIDSDHRVPITAPKLTDLYIEWFAKNVI